MMSDDISTVADLKQKVRSFSQVRDWEQFHHPKDLGVALTIEVGELLEHFRYRRHDEIAAHLAVPENQREFAHELADILWMVVRIADVTGIDLAAAFEEKVRLADQKYPVELVRGKSHKYTHYQAGRPAEGQRAADG